MTKSKKLISMLLAFVMLVTSCSLSFFAFAADSQEAIEAADSAAEAALNSMSANAVQATDTAMLEKINALQDVTKMNPYLYAYALHVATTQILTNKGKAKNATTRAAELTALANGDATTKAAYNAILPVPQDYIDVIADFNALNAQAVDADYASAKINQIGGSINNLYYGTNAAAKAKFEAFWANYKDYSAAQIDFADIIIIQMAGAVSNAFAPKEKNNYASANSFDSNVNYYFAERHGKRFAELYYRYLAMPLNGTVLKNKYIKSNKWATDEAAEEYYGLLKDFYANANANSKAFYVNYFTALEDAGDRYKGLANAAALNIDAGLKLVADEDVDFADIKAAYKAYDELSPEAKVLIKTISANVEALFNIQISNITMRENVKFGEGDEADSIAYLQANPSTMSNAAAYVGINDGKSKIVDLIGLVADEYAEYLPLDEYEEYVNGVIASGTITAENVTETWQKFNDLKLEFQNTVRATTDLWNNTETIMTSDFVNYVNGVDIDNVTQTNIDTATEKLENTVDEFKDVIKTGSKYKKIYDKYRQMLIAPFRYYVEGVDLNNITDENREKATELYNALSDDLKTLVKSDKTLYNTYIIIISSEFKDYVNSVDLDNVDDAVRKEAAEKYRALSDDAKKNAYEDEDVWAKYCQIQTPDVDPDKHSSEAAKKADKATLPKSSDAINNLGLSKSIDNVENFAIDDVLPLLTDSIAIDDKNDVVNSALEKYYTNATVGKIYSLYASLSHNQKEVEVQGTKVSVGIIAQILIPTSSVRDTLIEAKYASAKEKIEACIDADKVPTEEDGSPVQIDCGEDAEGKTIYEDANIYDAIAAIEFKSGDFGFKDGDKDGFVNAALAALRPMTAILSPEFNILGIKLGVEFFNYVDKTTGEFTFGVYECCVKALEALGVTGFMTDAQYKANYYSEFQKAYAAAEGSSYDKGKAAMAIAGDALLRPIVDNVFKFIDSDLHTITDVLALIPRLGDIITSDLPSTIYKNLTSNLGMLAPLVTDIKIDDVPLETVLNKYVLPNALLKLINDKLSGLGVTLAMPDLTELNKYTTFKVNASAQQDKDYVAVRYIDGDVMFTELVYYLYNNLFANKENAEGLKEKIGGIPLVGSNISTLVDKAVEAGKLDTYAAILDYFYDNGENKDATADAGKSIGEAIDGINATLNLSPIDASKAKVTLTKRKFSYNGKIQKPSVKVTLNGETLTKGVSYKVTYSNNTSKKIGTYKVTVTFIGGYEGKAKTVKYTIGPKNAKKVKLTAKKGAIKVTWKKSATKGVKGYVIKYSTNKNMKGAKTVTVKGASKTSKTITGLKSGKKYYVKIKSYMVKSGKKIYSPLSIAKTATVK